jgi:ribosomal protein S18 acetylase RimI-like enzyme
MWRVAKDQRRQGNARTLCAALLSWGAERGASRSNAQVLVDNSAAIALYESLGFTTQHRSRYIDARRL